MKTSIRQCVVWLAVATGAIGLLAPFDSGSARAGWSSVEQISTPADREVSQFRPTLDRRGDALLTTTFKRATPSGPTGYEESTAVAWRPRGRAFGSFVDQGLGRLEQVEAGNDGEFVTTAFEDSVFYSARTGGQFSRIDLQLGPTKSPYAGYVVGPDGSITVAWHRPAEGGRSEILTTTRWPSGAEAGPTTIATTRRYLGNPRVWVDSGGTTTIAWSVGFGVFDGKRWSISASSRLAGKDRYSRPQTLVTGSQRSLEDDSTWTALPSQGGPKGFAVSTEQTGFTCECGLLRYGFARQRRNGTFEKPTMRTVVRTDDDRTKSLVAASGGGAYASWAEYTKKGVKLRLRTISLSGRSVRTQVAWSAPRQFIDDAGVASVCNGLVLVWWMTGSNAVMATEFAKGRRSVTDVIQGPTAEQYAFASGDYNSTGSAIMAWSHGGPESVVARTATYSASARDCRSQAPRSASP